MAANEGATEFSGFEDDDLTMDIDQIMVILNEEDHDQFQVGISDTGFKPAELDHSGQVSKYYWTESAVHHPEYYMQGCSAVSSLADESVDQVTDCKYKMDPAWSNYDTEVQCGYMNYDVDRKRASQEQSDVEFGDFGTNCTGASEVPEADSYNSVEMSFLDADISSRNATSTESACQSSDGVSDWYYNTMVRRCIDNSPISNQSWGQNHFTTCFKTSQSNGGMIMNMNRVGEFGNESASCSSRISSNGHEERADAKCQRLIYNTGLYTSPIRGNYFSDADSTSFDEVVPAGSLMCSRSYIPGSTQTAPVKNEVQDTLLTPMDTAHRNAQTTGISVSNRSAYRVDENPFFGRGSKQFSVIQQKYETSANDGIKGVIPIGKTNQYSSVPQRLQACSKHEYEGVIVACKRARCSFEMVDRDIRSSIDSGYMDVKDIEPLPCHAHTILCKPDFTKDECQSQLKQHDNFVEDLMLVPGFFTPDTPGCNEKVENDSDVCISEEVSRVHAPQSIAPGNSLVASLHKISSDPNLSSQHSTISRAVGSSGVRVSRPRVNHETLVLQVALQDLSQPKLEASPPVGFLAVPLLRHQKIALSWMILKETNSLQCSGGILADDQGLGKTISTIALILKERPSSSRVFQEDIQQDTLETLNLDEDEDTFYDKEKLESTNNLTQLKGRPAAGTLVVCPTSVLRQWADELQNKVTSKAKLSVLVYHGSNRTKNPSELAKYDVVLTTYWIVGMEVPEQPLGDKYDRKGLPLSSTGASSSKSCHKKSSKKNKEKDSILLGSLARPLAKVGWFRVILDEAQSIKNHKTKVARACWSLHAKRRWCLSGTPVQNTIEDLYSYFRFLRYVPYSDYKIFCDTIKVPISKSPMIGYKKLQAVLKTIMLRRTKGTLLDGEPIITLPPKFVELKKVEFSLKERDFYSRLEADSRAQFAEYAAAGTVKQNYVNILLMLLRLRQACDHPLLVRKYDSGSAWKSSVEMLKELPQERQLFLFKCLEGSMAICGICNDPPEDAVVSTCGHVFCNQCISDHLTMDDRKCPATNCKDGLSEASVFSKVTLINLLSVQSGQDGLLDCPAAKLAEGVGSLFEDGSYESSKIKAAIEVLQALRPQNCAPSCNSALESSDTQVDKFSSVASKYHNSKFPVNMIGEKAIVFSQWTRMLDLLEDCMKKSSIQYQRLDGTMSVTARDKAVKEFNTNPEVSVIIMSLKAASLGLNMVAACHVILLDLWWNPTTEDQAVDRAHRIGQTRPVQVLRLTVKDTVEDRILELQGKKRQMVASAFGEDETGSRQSHLTVEDLKYLFMA